MKEWVDRPSFGSAIADLAGRVGTQERVDDPPPVRYRFEVVGSAAVDAATVGTGDLRSTPWMPPVDVVFDELWVVYGSANTPASSWSLERSSTTVGSLTVTAGSTFGFDRFDSPLLFTPMHRLTFYFYNDGTHDWLDATVMARGWSPVPFIGSGGLDFRLTAGGG